MSHRAPFTDAEAEAAMLDLINMKDAEIGRLIEENERLRALASDVEDALSEIRSLGFLSAPGADALKAAFDKAFPPSSFEPKETGP